MIDILAIHRENLLKLADLLDQQPQDRFDMINYRVPVGNLASNISLEFWDNEPKCGTVCCALGVAASHGIASEYMTGLDDWPDYAFAAFGVSSNHLSWVWLFDAIWHDVDNTPSGAAKRIRHYLEHGTPDNAEWQSCGDADYIFAEEDNATDES